MIERGLKWRRNTIAGALLIPGDGDSGTRALLMNMTLLDNVEFGTSFSRAEVVERYQGGGGQLSVSQIKRALGVLEKSGLLERSEDGLLRLAEDLPSYYEGPVTQEDFDRLDVECGIATLEEEANGEPIYAINPDFF